MNQTYGPTMMPGPPGMEAPPPPGWMGMTPQAFGMGGPKYGPQAGVHGMQQAQAQAGSMFGGSVMNAAAGAAHTGFQITSFGAMTVAPLLATYGSTMAVRGVGTAWAMTDPFGAGMAGARGGWAMAEGASLGMGSRLAMGAVGGTLVGAAVALPVLAAQSWIEHSLKGARDAMLGRSTLQSMAASHGGAFGQGPISAGQGASFGRDLSDLSKQMGTSTDELASLTKQLDQMKVFQSTRNVSEFRSKFKEVLGAIKEIATTTKQTLEDATQTFGELKQQGFYTTADITAQAAKRSAQSATSGVDGATLSAYGGMGAQYARSLGMKGRVGADYMTQSVSSMATAYRGMSAGQQEIVDEHGGPEEMAASMAAKNMRFLSSARGRAMIAATLGAGGRPDASRMHSMLTGNMTTEGIVEAAAGSGLGTLGAAGTAKVREQYLQYADPMQIMTAASQSRQLYGGVSMKGITTMMGTMGWSAEETSTKFALTMQMPKILADQQREQTRALQMADYTKRKESASWTGQVGKSWDHYTDGWETSAGRAWSGAGTTLQRAYEDATGFDTTTVGDKGRARARGFMAGGKGLDPSLSRGYRSGAFFGPESEQDTILKQYGGYAQEVRRGEGGSYIGKDGKKLDPDDVIELTERSNAARYAPRDRLDRNAPKVAAVLDTQTVISRSALKQAQADAQETSRFDEEGAAKIRRTVAGGYADSSFTGRIAGFALQWGSGTQGQAWNEEVGAKGSLDFERSLYSSYVGSGPGRLQQGELNNWLIGRKSGVNNKFGDIESYVRAKSESPKEFYAHNRRVEQSTGWAKGTGAVGGLSAAEAKDRLRTGFQDMFWGGGIGQGGVTGFLHAATVGQFSKNRNLVDKLVDNTETAEAFSSLMLAKDAKATMVAADQLKDALGEDSAEYGQIKDMLGDEALMKATRGQYSALGISGLMGQHASATSVEARAKGIRAGVTERSVRRRDKNSKEISYDPRTERAILGLSSEATGDLLGASKELLSAMAASGGDIDDDERHTLTQVTGGTGASTFVAKLGWMASGSAKDSKAAAASLGIDEATLAEAMKGLEGDGNYSKRLQKAVDLVHDSGALGEMFSEESGEVSTVEGSQVSAIVANKEFVTEVKAFVEMIHAKFPKMLAQESE